MRERDSTFIARINKVLDFINIGILNNSEHSYLLDITLGLKYF